MAAFAWACYALAICFEFLLNMICKVSIRKSERRKINNSTNALFTKLIFMKCQKTNQKAQKGKWNEI